MASTAGPVRLTKPLWRACAFLLLSIPFLQGAAQTGSIPTPDGGLYTGEVVEGKFHGRGRIEWPSGEFYDGEFRDGRYHGKGTIRYPGGAVYEGDFSQGAASGRGRWKGIDGSRYIGQFRDDQFEGRGRLNGADGSVYVGDFRVGLFHGSGTLTTDGGSVYRGKFRRGLYHGQGELRVRGGAVYRGNFAHGQLHGVGRVENSKGVYEGEFVRGEFTGKGVYTDSGGARVEGQFANWNPHGPAKVVDPRGATYEGVFEDGALTQNARVTTPEWEYLGELKNWRPHGKGELRLANGDRYSGQFELGVYHGEGVLNYAKPLADGRSEDRGDWRYGRLVKDEEQQRQLVRSGAELALYTQRELLQQALAQVAPPQPGTINLYLLAIGGDGSQEVFRREVEFVRDQFDTAFGTRGRSVALVNSRSTIGKTPLATMTAIRQSIAAIASRMDRERDILFLFVTSHGYEDKRISLAMPGIDLPELRAVELAQILKESGARWKVVVLSACYAGGFIDDLREPGSLILAAARHDRRSFGCADENDFTYFGRAFFKEALPRSASFQEAFEEARKLVHAWEQDDSKSRRVMQATEGDKRVDLDSLPQMENPPEVAAHLNKWWAQMRKQGETQK